MDNKVGSIAAGIGSLMFPQVFLAKKLIDLAVSAVESDKSTEKSTTPELREHAERQELEQRIKQANAKIAQEYAIAARIQTAEEVEMEECYEYVASGNGGFQANLATGDVGVTAGGETRRVSKRIYRFKGGLQLDCLSDQVEISASLSK